MTLGTIPVRVRKMDLELLREKYPQLANEKNTTIVNMALIMLRVGKKLSDDFFLEWVKASNVKIK